MGSKITIELDETLTPEQEQKLAQLLTIHVRHTVSRGAGLPAELDRRISIDQRLDDHIEQEGIRAPSPMDLLRDHFREALFEGHNPILMAASCWHWMKEAGADLDEEIRLAAEDWPALETNRAMIAAAMRARVE